MKSIKNTAIHSFSGFKMVCLYVIFLIVIYNCELVSAETTNFLSANICKNHSLSNFLQLFNETLVNFDEIPREFASIVKMIKKSNPKGELNVTMLEKLNVTINDYVENMFKNFDYTKYCSSNGKNLWSIVFASIYLFIFICFMLCVIFHTWNKN